MSHVGAGARGPSRDQGGYKSPSGVLPGSPLPDQSASTGAPHVRSYVPQQGEKGKGQGRERLVSPSEPRAVCHTPDPPALPAVLEKTRENGMPKSFAEQPAALARLPGLANTVLQVCGQTLDDAGGRGAGL